MLVSVADAKSRRYIRLPNPVAAVRLKLDTAGLTYRKWGHRQRAKRGDWIVDNDGDVYTVDAAVFARTYKKTGTGTYEKTTSVWARQAERGGSVKTKEGATKYKAGDYLVSNKRDGSDAYAMTARKFKSLYTLAGKRSKA